MIEKHKYVPEIDSLRAVAVFAVIVNHFNPLLLPGGYLGVDLFFVISGFVVTSSLKGSLHKNSKEFFGDFYLRRVKRLYPALLACLLIFSIISFFLIASPKVVIKTAFFAMFGLSNIFLANSSADYFSLDAENNVFTHTWSLGVEEQFYLIYPVIFYFMMRKKSFAPNSNILIFVTFLSFLFFILTSFFNDIWSFYLLPARFWQLALGAIVFLCIDKSSRMSSFLVRHSFFLFFVLLICFFIPLELRVLSTILITIIASLFLLILSHNEVPFLKRGLMVGCGKMSYSLYLFHWPVIVLFKSTIGLGSIYLVLAALFLIITTSLFSYIFIEKKLRYMDWSSRSWSAMFICMLVILIMLLAIKPFNNIFFVGQFKPAYSVWDNYESKKMDNCYVSSHAKGYLSSFEDFAKNYIDNCQFVTVPNPKRKIFSFGNSYTEEKIGAYTRLAEFWSDTDVYSYIVSGTPLTPFEYRYREHSSKKLYLSHFFQLVENIGSQGDLVFLSTPLSDFSSGRKHYFDDKDNEVLGSEILKKSASFLSDWRNKLQKKGIEIYFISAYPVITMNTPERCFQPWSVFNSECFFEKSLNDEKNIENLKVQEDLQSYLQENLIDVYSLFLSKINKTDNPFILFHNQTHLNEKGAKLLFEILSTHEKIQHSQ